MDRRRGRNLQETVRLEEERQHVHERAPVAARDIQRVYGAPDKPRLPVVEPREVIAHFRGHFVEGVHADRHADVGVADMGFSQ